VTGLKIFSGGLHATLIKMTNQTTDRVLKLNADQTIGSADFDVTDIVRITQQQTLSGDKTFTGTSTFSGGVCLSALNASQIFTLDANRKVVSGGFGISEIVRTTQQQTISGDKTFSGASTFSGGSTFSGPLNLSNLNSSQILSLDANKNIVSGGFEATDIMRLTQAQTITGAKTFSGSLNLSSLTASQVLSLDANKNIVATSLPVLDVIYANNRFVAENAVTSIAGFGQGLYFTWNGVRIGNSSFDGGLGYMTFINSVGLGGGGFSFVNYNTIDSTIKSRVVLAAPSSGTERIAFVSEIPYLTAYPKLAALSVGVLPPSRGVCTIKGDLTLESADSMFDGTNRIDFIQAYDATWDQLRMYTRAEAGIGQLAISKFKVTGMPTRLNDVACFTGASDTSAAYAEVFGRIESKAVNPEFTLQRVSVDNVNQKYTPVIKWSIRIAGSTETAGVDVSNNIGFYYNDMYRGGFDDQASDVRIKSDIRPLDLDRCLEKVLSLNLYSFLYVDQETPKRFIGFIAQELIDINPYCISQVQYRTDADDLIYTLSYRDMFIHNIGATKCIHHCLTMLENDFKQASAQYLKQWQVVEQQKQRLEQQCLEVDQQRIEVDQQRIELEQQRLDLDSTKQTLAQAQQQLAVQQQQLTAQQHQLTAQQQQITQQDILIQDLLRMVQDLQSQVSEVGGNKKGEKEHAQKETRKKQRAM
jgi:hypothetical protein